MLYLEEYLDTIEGLPMELQRQFTLMRELDALSQELQSKMQTDITDYLDNLPNMTREERVTKLQSFTQLFSNALKHGEEKVALATQTYELVDKHIRKLDEDLAKFELRQLTMPPRIAHSWGPGATTLSVDKSTSPQAGDGGPSKSGESGGSGTKRQRSAQSSSPNAVAKPASGGQQGQSGGRRGQSSSGKRGENSVVANSKSKSSSKGTSSQILGDMPIDPNEPRYCYCNQVSYGEMVACDDDNCEIEWFHLGCVDLKAPPKGKWYCKRCLANRKKKRDQGSRA